jgi:hypothetical protein
VGNWIVANQADSTRAQTLSVRASIRRAVAGPLWRASDLRRLSLTDHGFVPKSRSPRS